LPRLDRGGALQAINPSCAEGFFMLAGWLFPMSGRLAAGESRPDNRCGMIS
jgi:hypothetical protein